MVGYKLETRKASLKSLNNTGNWKNQPTKPTTFIFINIVVLFDFSTPPPHTMLINCAWAKILSLESLPNLTTKLIILFILFYSHTRSSIPRVVCLVCLKIYPKSNREITENKITIENFWKLKQKTENFNTYTHNNWTHIHKGMRVKLFSSNTNVLFRKFNITHTYTNTNKKPEHQLDEKRRFLWIMKIVKMCVLKYLISK